MVREFTQKYTIISILEDIDEDADFSSLDWPLHVTIVDMFAIQLDIDNLINRMTIFAKKRKPIKTKASYDDYFGQNNNILVTLLDMSKELLDLHYDVLLALECVGLVFDNPQFIREGFKAHCTAQSHVRLKEGDSVIINNLAIVDMFPGGDPYKRKIIKKLKLTGKGL